ncbi:hypothetical protein [Pseudalkalibacillus sp. SCS-8]|uniref:hypothetical protein n=1 Tax=Pseudalkalibacillus nanhaiensis TaxID=3115291 RepID=UPI0032DAF7A7
MATYVFLRALEGQTLSEVMIEGMDGMILTNVVLVQANAQYAIFNQAGSGGIGQIMVPINNISGIIM